MDPQLSGTCYMVCDGACQVPCFGDEVVARRRAALATPGRGAWPWDVPGGGAGLRERITNDDIRRSAEGFRGEIRP